MKYNDWITDTPLLAGCMAVYDRRKSKPVLLGVNCMDINMVVDLKTLEAHPEYKTFEKAFNTASRRCLNGVEQNSMPTEAECASEWEAAFNNPIYDAGPPGDSAAAAQRRFGSPELTWKKTTTPRSLLQNLSLLFSLAGVLLPFGLLF